MFSSTDDEQRRNTRLGQANYTAEKERMMAAQHGKEYRIKIVSTKGASQYSDWFNSYDEAYDALGGTKRSIDATYFMQERNVFQEGDRGNPELSETPIDVTGDHT